MDVLIIGAGPAGVAAAKTLLDQGFTGRIHLVERGRRLKRRICPIDQGRVCHGCGGICNVLSGFGGCIHYGDAVKLSLLPAGRRLQEKLGPDAVTHFEAATEMVARLIDRPISFCDVEHRPSAEESFSFKPYPVAVISAAQVRGFLEQMFEHLASNPRLHMMMESEVTDIVQLPGGGYRARIDSRRTGSETIFADQVIVAVGRGGMFWWRKTIRDLGLAFQFPQPSVGLRFELNQRWLAPAGTLHPDYKVTMRQPAGKFKSFCYCAGTGGGQIKYTDYGDFCLLDGHVASAEDRVPDGKAPGNFALLYQLPTIPPDVDPMAVVMDRYIAPYQALRPDSPGKPVAQRFNDFRERRGGPTSWAALKASLNHRPSVEDLAPARIDSLFKMEEHQGFCQAVERYMNEVLGHTSGVPQALIDDILVIALELEGLWDVMDVDMHLETSSPGLFVTGDAAGIAQGILQAMATGIVAARRIVGRSSTRTHQSDRDRLVYDHYWTVGDYYEPSETFVRLVDLLQAEQGRGIRVADLGCGIGRHALYAGSRGARVVAIDHSGRAISKLKSKFDSPLIDVVEGDFAKWLEDGPDADLDGVVCFDALHHISSDSEKVLEVLREMQRRVRPGGLVLISLLADIDYGQGGGPANRFMVSTEEAERLLDRVFAAAEPLRSKCTEVRFDQTINLDPASGRMVQTYYKATRVIRLFQLAGSAQLVASA
jgi:uncharacterized FAD-dependent dehydrogenase/SAM-dependent methyltransferase